MWMYKGQEFTEDMIPEGAVGFIYRMTIPSDDTMGTKIYIGKKNFFSDVKTKLGKKEMPTDKRLKTYKRVRRTTYKNYYSSNDTIKAYKAAGGKVTRVILKICYSKLELTYEETRYLFGLNAIKEDNYLNDNILGKFFRKQLKTE